MKQPVLGERLVSLRKEKNLTQEELVERSHVSVRTIQRIEAGEVIPRLSTIKIIAKALDVDFETIVQTNQNQMEENKNLVSGLLNPDGNSDAGKTALITAAIGGIIYLVLEIAKTALDVAWMMNYFGKEGDIIYTVVVLCLLVSYFFFIRGFIVFGNLFENGLLKIVGYLLLLSMVGLSALDIYSFIYFDTRGLSTIPEALLLPYISFAGIFGVLGVIFGASLLKLQDGMGELSKVAGILEIVMGILLFSIVLFFLAYAIMIPATILEIILLYRGYEYLSKTNVSQSVVA